MVCIVDIIVKILMENKLSEDEMGFVPIEKLNYPNEKILEAVTSSSNKGQLELMKKYDKWVIRYSREDIKMIKDHREIPHVIYGVNSLDEKPKMFGKYFEFTTIPQKKIYLYFINVKKSMEKGIFFFKVGSKIYSLGIEDNIPPYIETITENGTIVFSRELNINTIVNIIQN